MYNHLLPLHQLSQLHLVAYRMACCFPHVCADFVSSKAANGPQHERIDDCCFQYPSALFLISFFFFPLLLSSFSFFLFLLHLFRFFLLLFFYFYYLNLSFFKAIIIFVPSNHFFAVVSFQWEKNMKHEYLVTQVVKSAQFNSHVSTRVRKLMIYIYSSIYLSASNQRKLEFVSLDTRFFD